MAGQRGIAILKNPKTGEVFAAWNLKSGIRDAYPPGSTAKIVGAAASLEEGKLAPQDQIICKRIPPLLGGSFQCVHPPVRDGFTLSSALANSCNYFFTVVGLRLSAEVLAHWYSVFGFGIPVETDAGPAGSGRVTIRADARRKALAVLGEQEVLATPAQLLEAYSILANHGEAVGLWTLGKDRHRVAGDRQIHFQKSTLAALTDGLVECVRTGTCREAAVPGVQVAGKTGTATALDGSGATHAWFVGFAPAENPEVSIVVFLERGTGAHSAAPLAGKMLQYYFAARNR